MNRSILFKIWKFPQLSETFIVNQVVLALKLGYDVKILAGELTDVSCNANFELFQKYNLCDKIIIQDHRIPKQKLKRIFKAFWLVLINISLLRTLIKYLKELNKFGLSSIYEFFFYKDLRGFDVIHIQFGTNKHPIDILKKTGFIKSKLIVSFHGHDLYFPINNRIPNNGYYSRLFETADFLIANTVFLKDKLVALKAPVEKIKIIPVAVDTTIFKKSISKNENRILKLLTIGRLDELKGQQYGIRAVKLLVQKGLNIEYMIVGSGIEEEKLKNLIDKLELTSSVFLNGSSKPDEIPELLQNSHLFLMTSITNSKGMEETQGLVTAEAQACGLPVVAFDTGGVKYTMIDGKTGFICKEKDLLCYVQKIELLLKNDTLRNEMGLDAIRFIEKEYSENAVLNKWKIIYSFK